MPRLLGALPVRWRGGWDWPTRGAAGMANELRRLMAGFGSPASRLRRPNRWPMLRASMPSACCLPEWGPTERAALKKCATAAVIPSGRRRTAAWYTECRWRHIKSAAFPVSCRSTKSEASLYITLTAPPNRNALNTKQRLRRTATEPFSLVMGRVPKRFCVKKGIQAAALTRAAHPKRRAALLH